MLLAVFEHVDRSDQVVLDDLTAAGLARDPREDTRVRGRIDDPIGLR